MNTLGKEYFKCLYVVFFYTEITDKYTGTFLLMEKSDPLLSIWYLNLSSVLPKVIDEHETFRIPKIVTTKLFVSNYFIVFFLRLV